MAKATKKETKQQRSVSIYPTHLKEVEKKYGSLTKFVDHHLAHDEKITKKNPNK
ncbi:hypothetical protein [Nostoc linckia]|uniref:hypothetical protein n=1 Tax=Nostoc linckia TaxID=92942 RepID=UPI0015D52349|nr:hypothetical protein [Nostoc linckia]